MAHNARFAARNAFRFPAALYETLPTRPKVKDGPLGLCFVSLLYRQWPCLSRTHTLSQLQGQPLKRLPNR
jgi:hypothetical protein